MVDIARALNREAICKYSFSKGSNLGEFSSEFHNNFSCEKIDRCSKWRLISHSKVSGRQGFPTWPTCDSYGSKIGSELSALFLKDKVPFDSFSQVKLLSVGVFIHKIFVVKGCDSITYSLRGFFHSIFPSDALYISWNKVNKTFKSCTLYEINAT